VRPRIYFRCEASLLAEAGRGLMSTILVNITPVVFFCVELTRSEGSSEYGRAYRERLRGGWGVVDIMDVVNAAKAISSAPHNLVDPKKLVVRGGSSGGYTALSSLSTLEKEEDLSVSYLPRVCDVLYSWTLAGLRCGNVSVRNLQLALSGERRHTQI